MKSYQKLLLVWTLIFITVKIFYMLKNSERKRENNEKA